MTRMGAIQVTPELEEYVESLLPARDPVLLRLEDQVATTRTPGIGPALGQFVALLLRASGSHDVIELGTAVGYSTIWLARGCTGEVMTTELDAGRAEEARRNLAEAGLADRVRVVEEEAVAYLEREERQVDAIFNDVLNYFSDEDAVDRCFAASLRRLHPGGLLLTDNALRRGEVLSPKSAGARNVARWNALVAAEPGLDSVIVPLRDGVSIARLS
jgi:caffeoyl-CoA O-methyltransferase